jgi:four helix bundle protein
LPADKARFYRIARRSTTECAAILDVARTLSLATVDRLQHGRALLLRIVAMLTDAVLKLRDSNSDSDSTSEHPDP